MISFKKFLLEHKAWDEETKVNIAQGIKDGLTPKQIAKKHGLNHSTLRNHISRNRDRYGYGNIKGVWPDHKKEYARTYLSKYVKKGRSGKVTYGSLTGLAKDLNITKEQLHHGIYHYKLKEQK